jgi:predicted dehydrogenase
MKFLICGLGSIGQRHYKNLVSLGYKDIVVFRTGKGSSSFVDRFIKEFKPVIFTDLNKSLSQKPDVVFVTNPTSQHVSVAYKAAKAGCHVFIEKPISNSLKDVGKLVKEIKKQKLVSYVAYNFRFHPLLNTLKKWLNNTKIFGKVISFHATLGERVTDWHPWEDYRSSYACSKDLGGGAVLTQSHEIDYIHWLFGPIGYIDAIGGKLSDLDIDVEDTVKVILRLKSGIVGSLDLDFLRRPPERKLEVITTKGKIVWDFYGKSLKFIPLNLKASEVCILEPESFERNSMYLDELKHFIKIVSSKKETINPVKENVNTLSTLISIRKFIIKK